MAWKTLPGSLRTSSAASGSWTTCVRYALGPTSPLTTGYAQIGEISLMKEMTSVATTMMSDEEKAEMEKELNEGRGPASPSPAAPPHGVMPTSPATSPAAATPATSTPGEAAATAPATASAANGTSTSLTPSPMPSPGDEQKNLDQKNVAAGAHTHKDKDKRKSKLTPEQKKKLQELEDERRKNMEERINTLAKKLVDRLRPFVHAKRPGDKDDPETLQFEAKMKLEADDLKLESFGVEVSTSCEPPPR